MAYRLIKTEGNSILEKISKPVTEFDDRLASLLDDMKDTLYKADGAGLAAVQVGILKRVVVIDVSEDRDGLIELVNPVITESHGEQRQSEGCLSVPDKTGVTKRPMYVTAKAQDRNGKWFEIKGEGLLARCVCHELDHLDGILFTEKLADGEKLHYTK